MKLYVYADESGVFDQAHNDLFVYGGIVIPGADAKAELEHRYAAVERLVSGGSDAEVKACNLVMRERKRLYKVLESGPCVQFGVVIDQKRLDPGMFADKRLKQRYQDWALKMGVKRGIAALLGSGAVRRGDVSKIAVRVDEHSSSTAGRYNLRDSINEELRCGMYDSLGCFHQPLFSSDLPEIPVEYLDSSKVSLIRAADITANWIFCAVRDREGYPAALESVRKSAELYFHPSCL